VRPTTARTVGSAQDVDGLVMSADVNLTTMDDTRTALYLGVRRSDMGWIAATAYRIGRGSVASPVEIEEAAGFDGERVTPSWQTTSKAYPAPFTIPRRGRTVHATRGKAMRESRTMLRSSTEERT
jgi:hypothetical protein